MFPFQSNQSQQLNLDPQKSTFWTPIFLQNSLEKSTSEGSKKTWGMNKISQNSTFLWHLLRFGSGTSGTWSFCSSLELDLETTQLHALSVVSYCFWWCSCNFGVLLVVAQGLTFKRCWKGGWGFNLVARGRRTKGWPRDQRTGID